MSTEAKRPHAEALAIAKEFSERFAGKFERWTIAGSIRRLIPEIGDAEHVVQPKLEEFTPEGSLIPNLRNAVWGALDELLAAGVVAKHRRADGAACWGTLQRRCIYRGMSQEVFTADALNWGAILAIRTGPADLSKFVVSRMKGNGTYRQEDGYVRLQRGPNSGTIVPCPDERSFFEFAGMAYREPEHRT